MPAVVVAAVVGVLFFLGYRCSSSYLAHEVDSVDPAFVTPAHEFEDGNDSVPTDEHAGDRRDHPRHAAGPQPQPVDDHRRAHPARQADRLRRPAARRVHARRRAVTSRVVLVRGSRTAAGGGGGCCSAGVRPFDEGRTHRHADEVPSAGAPVDEVAAVRAELALAQ